MVPTVQMVQPQIQPADNQGSLDSYRYDAASGTCRNGVGQVGYNLFDLAAVKGTKDAECFDLRGVELIELEADIEFSLGYNKLIDWNFRGANLNGAKLFFNLLVNADLRGTKFSQLEFGYASVAGKVDAFSEIPARCDRVGGTVRCQQ